MYAIEERGGIWGIQTCGGGEGGGREWFSAIVSVSHLFSFSFYLSMSLASEKERKREKEKLRKRKRERKGERMRT